MISDRDTPEFAAAAEKLRAIAPNVIAIPADLTNNDDLKRLIEQTVSHFGRLDALVNCGGVPYSGAITDDKDADFDRLYHTNVRSIWMLTRFAMDHMKAVGGGSIVSIASINGHLPTFFCALYAGTKSAVLNMSRELAVELSPLGIRVNTVSPGVIPNPNVRLHWLSKVLHEPFATELSQEFTALMNDPVSHAQPIPIHGTGQDIGLACLYLCSPAARFITGIDILVDGGKNTEMPEIEPRFANRTQSGWQHIRQRLLNLPEEAWSGEKPFWLKRQKAATPTTATQTAVAQTAATPTTATQTAH